MRLGLPRRSRPALGQAFPWLLGLAAGAVALGPALGGGGSLLSLDLVVTPRIPVPRGVWGLGPELPRRVPFTVPLAWASTVVGGSRIWTLVALAAFAAASAGAWKLAEGAPAIARSGAALLYALSPFVLTRLGVGDLALVVAMAILPWALPTLLRPDEDLRRTFLWAAALGCTGQFGGVLGLFVVAVGVLGSRGRRAPGVAGAYVLAQLPWVVPGAILLSQPLRLTHSSAFATQASGLGGWLRVLAGYGFWQPRLQVGPVGGGAGTGAAFAGAALGALAVVGARDLPRPWGRRAAWLALTGVALGLASAVPGVRVAYSAVADTRLGAPLREGQRLLALYLVWMAPAAALGAARLARLRVGLLEGVLWAAPFAIAVVLAGPGLLGVDGRLDPVSLPSEWSRARTAVVHRPGTVLALPWHEYLQLQVAGDRNVFNPVPIYFGGDVLSSSDPEFQSGPEQADPREPTARRLLGVIRAGDPVASELARLGVRWVVLLHEVDWQSYDSIAHDPGLVHAVGGPSLDLWRVRAWRGPVVDRTGRTVRLRTLVQPFGRLDASGPATWFRPSENGWMRGWSAAGATPAGLLRLPAGSGPVWYWPALLVLAADLATAATAAVVLVRLGAIRARKSPVSGQNGSQE
jgi:hypothetical protein